LQRLLLLLLDWKHWEHFQYLSTRHGTIANDDRRNIFYWLCRISTNVNVNANINVNVNDGTTRARCCIVIIVQDEECRSWSCWCSWSWWISTGVITIITTVWRWRWRWRWCRRWCLRGHSISNAVVLSFYRQIRTERSWIVCCGCFVFWFHFLCAECQFWKEKRKKRGEERKQRGYNANSKLHTISIWKHPTHQSIAVEVSEVDSMPPLLNPVLLGDPACVLTR